MKEMVNFAANHLLNQLRNGKILATGCIHEPTISKDGDSIDKLHRLL